MKKYLSRVLMVLSFGFIPVLSFAEVEVIQSSATVVTPVNSTAPVAVVTPAVVVVDEHHDRHDYGWGELSLSGGKAFFKGSSDSYLEDSPAVSIGFFGPTGRFGQFGLELGYLTGARLKGTLPSRLNPIINGQPATGPFTTDVHAHIASATPEVRLGPLVKAGSVAIMPYIVGGGGLYWTRYNEDDLNFSNGSGRVNSTDEFNGGWNAGAGLTLGVAPGVGISVDVRYHDIVYSDGPDTTYLLPQGKLVFMF